MHAQHLRWDNDRNIAANHASKLGHPCAKSDALAGKSFHCVLHKWPYWNDRLFNARSWGTAALLPSSKRWRRSIGGLAPRPFKFWYLWEERGKNLSLLPRWRHRMSEYSYKRFYSDHFPTIRKFGGRQWESSKCCWMKFDSAFCFRDRQAMSSDSLLQSSLFRICRKRHFCSRQFSEN